MINSATAKSACPFSSNFRSAALNAGFAISVIASSLVLSQPALAQGAETVAAIEDLSITVESGDTYSSILARELQSFDAWGEVARYNKLESLDDLKPGDVIVIPKSVLLVRNFATVVFVKGAALHHNSVENTKLDLTKGDKIYPGDLIETDIDGFVSVSFNGGTSVNIQPESTMKINVLDCTDREDACEINLGSEKGQIGLDVQSVGFEKPTVFNITTPYASAAVRGTRFDFDIDDGNILGVTEGVVEIELNGVSNNIESGKGVFAGEGKSIDELYDLLVKPELVLLDDITRISGEDIINWQPLADADSYLFRVAPDEAMQALLFSLSESATFIKPELPLGEYFASLRAVASNGLRGFTDQKKVVSVEIDPDAEPVVLNLTVTDSELEIIANGEPGEEIEVKIGNSLATIESAEYLVSETILRMAGQETITLEFDREKEWYVQGRRVLDDSTVSPYGLLYFFEKVGG